MRMSVPKKHQFKTTVAVAAVVGGLAAGFALWGGPVDTTVEAASTKVSKPAKNVIVMISDGWGYNHVAATDYYTGKKQEYEKFPVRLAMSTYEYEDVSSAKKLLGYDPVLYWKDFGYSVEPLATDSASAATAMSSGVKTKNGAIGVAVDNTPLFLITQRAEERGMATGVVTSVEWSHATPAGFVAHNASRGNYAAIAQEMIDSSATDVIMGAGNPEFDDNGQPAAKGSDYVGGSVLWSALKAGGYAPNDADGDGSADPWTLIQTKAEFELLAAAKSTPKRVCGTAQVYSTLQQARSGDGNAAPYAAALNSTVPDLATMTKGAMNVLEEDEDGFFLMIEGGAVDWAGHANQTGRMIEEQADFNKAVDAVVAWVQKHSDWSETLLIVTGDHETGNLWGPGSGIVNGVANYTSVVNNGKGNVPGVKWNSGGHTNQLVPLFAKGPAANLLKTYVRTSDPVRGGYIDNTDMADLLFRAIQ